MSAAKRKAAARLQRLKRAQAALALAERAALMEAEHDRVTCAAEAEAIVASLSDDSPLHGLMVPAMARLLSANAREATRLEEAAAAAANRLRREEARTDAMERRARKAERAVERAEEERRLEDLVTARACKIDPQQFS